MSSSSSLPADSHRHLSSRSNIPISPPPSASLNFCPPLVHVPSTGSSAAAVVRKTLPSGGSKGAAPQKISVPPSVRGANALSNTQDTRGQKSNQPTRNKTNESHAPTTTTGDRCPCLLFAIQPLSLSLRAAPPDRPRRFFIESRHRRRRRRPAIAGAVSREGPIGNRTVFSS